MRVRQTFSMPKKCPAKSQDPSTLKVLEPVCWKVRFSVNENQGRKWPELWPIEKEIRSVF
jgi:hypothetical protein